MYRKSSTVNISTLQIGQARSTVQHGLCILFLTAIKSASLLYMSFFSAL